MDAWTIRKVYGSNPNGDLASPERSYWPPPLRQQTLENLLPTSPALPDVWATFFFFFSFFFFSFFLALFMVLLVLTYLESLIFLINDWLSLCGDVNLLNYFYGSIALPHAHLTQLITTCIQTKRSN
jgi:hypothetical protein